jgi:imidazolonepropionase-like amidohydrolase
MSVAEASDAGQRSQEHLINVLLACSTQEEKLRGERIAVMTTPQLVGEARLRLLAFPKTEGLFDTYSDEKAAALFAKFVSNDTWHTPTLVLLDAFVKRQDLTRQQFYMRDLDDAAFAVEMTHIRALLVRYQKLVSDMHRAGVKFLAGTDSSAFTVVLPGAGLHDELALLVESGLTPLEALQAATRNPAIYFGKLAEWGTIEAGKAADLVLLDADPLQDIHNTRKIRAVVLKGKYFEPQMNAEERR